MMHAVARLHQEDLMPACDVWLVAAADEEHSFRGVLRLCEGLQADAAIVAEPTDPNGYRGLAALHEATGSDPSDGTNSLRDISQALTDAGYQTQAPPEPEPAVAPSASSSHWQETSAEFNRRMNSLYSSNAWSGVYRTVFSGGLYP